MTGWDLDYFYDTTLDFPGKDATTFGFLINYSKKRSLEKESNSTFWSVEGFDFFAKNGGYFYEKVTGKTTSQTKNTHHSLGIFFRNSFF